MARTKLANKHYGYASKVLNPSPKSTFQTTKDFIKKSLSEGPKSTNDVKAEAKAEGVNTNYFNKARLDLGIVTFREGPLWMWRLPNAEEKEKPVDVLREGVVELGEDSFSLTADEKQMYGIKDNEQHCWIRDPRYWTKQPGVSGDDARTLKHQVPGSRIIMHDGDYVENGSDLILAVVPKSWVEKNKAAQLQLEKEYHGQIDRQKMADDYDPNDEDNLERQKAINSANAQAAGMIGAASPSHGMPMEDYIRNRGLTAKEIEHEELTYALRRGTDVESFMKEISERPRNSSGKFVSIPANVRPRNLAQPAAK